MKEDINRIIEYSLNKVLPDESVRRALDGKTFSDGRLILVSVGKASWQMAKAASEMLEFAEGAVITKYGHDKGEIKDLEIYEAGHPLLDENSIKASKRVWEMTAGLKENDTVIFLVSGGSFCFV